MSSPLLSLNLACGLLGCVRPAVVNPALNLELVEGRADQTKSTRNCN